MPRGRKVQHKGRGKRYLTEEEIRIAEEKKKRETGWKIKKGIEVDSDEEEENEPAAAASRGAAGEMPPSDSSDDSSEQESSEEDQVKNKGVDGFIEVDNPNRRSNKVIKAKDVDVNAKVELSRKEREEIEKQRAIKTYAKLHQEGKTEESKSDLARLAIIRQQREETARQRSAAQAPRQPKN